MFITEASSWALGLWGKKMHFHPGSVDGSKLDFVHHLPCVKGYAQIL